MRNKLNILVSLSCLSMLLISLAGCGSAPNRNIQPFQNGPSATRQTPGPEKGLLFPFADTEVVEKYYAFGLRPWDGERPHNGIDIVPFFRLPTLPGEFGGITSSNKKTIRKTKIIAAAPGQVKAVLHMDNPYADAGLGLSIMVFVEINDYWHYEYSFEPKTPSSVLQEAQANSITVSPGQRVRAGDEIGYLIIGDGGESDQYPHIHISLFYKPPEISYWEMLENPKSYQVHDGTNVPERIFRSSDISGHDIFTLPERDLEIKPTLFCAYYFSSDQAKAIYDSKTVMGGVGNTCDSVCLYQSRDGNCGTGTPAYLTRPVK